MNTTKGAMNRPTLSSQLSGTPVFSYFVFAYSHARLFKNKMGGLIKVYEVTDTLAKRGHRLSLFIPRIGLPELQTSAVACAVPFELKSSSKRSPV
jgi:hypothetical protein